MHAVIPYRVVVHVHSVNTIARAVRQDAYIEFSERLEGLPWCWIPYIASGIPLAREMKKLLRARQILRFSCLATTAWF